MRCADCDHLRATHFSQTGEAVPCRITGCKCQAFASAAREEQPKPEGRRVAIDLPDGYMLSFSLVPYTPEAIAAEEEPEAADATGD